MIEWRYKLQNPEKQQRRPLTELERSRVLQWISSRCQPEDRQPEEVIRTTYKGDIDAYIQDMLRFNGLLKDKS